MYFQTGQVIFVPEWPKREFVSILASFCVWTKSIMLKDVVNRDSTCQSIFRRLCTAKKIEYFRVPVSRPDVHLSLFHPSGRRAIPSGIQTDQASSVRTTCLSVWTLHYVEMVLSSLHPSGRL
jgi:hypothetical protein